jgi:capsular polysaccharide biosynthesis protein
MRNKTEEISVKDFFSIFVSKLWLIAVVAVLFSAVACVYSVFFTKDTYTSSAQMFVYTDPKSTNFEYAENSIDIYKTIITSTDFFNQVIESLPEDVSDKVSVAMLKSAVTVSNSGKGVFSISVTTYDSDLSFEIANTMVELIPSEIVRRIPPALSISPLIDPHPSVMNGKSIFRNAIIAFFAGVVLACVCVWVASMFDSVIRDKKKIEDNFDIPVIGLIPVCEVPQNRSREV